MATARGINVGEGSSSWCKATSAEEVLVGESSPTSAARLFSRTSQICLLPTAEVPELVFAVTRSS